MPPRFPRYDPAQLFSFPRFNDLPKELRLAIWEYAATVPRIVHLTKKTLRTDKDPDWWRYVRSDKSVDDEDDFYDTFELPDFEISRINRDVACQRLLTRDEDYNGSMTREEARRILHSPPRYSYYVQPLPPRPLHGFRSETIPSVLLACQESFEVASKVYSRVFVSLGAFPQTYFNFQQDTLYLDSNSVLGHWSSDWNLLGVTWTLKHLLGESDLAKVKKLAVFWDKEVIRALGDGGYQFVDWLHNLHRCFPVLKEFTIVEDHFVYNQEVDSRQDKASYQILNRRYDNLKYESSRINWDGRTRNLRIHGYLIDESLPRPGHIVQMFDQQNWNRRAAEAWTTMYPKAGEWKLPVPVFKNLITESDERQLLDDARMFQKKYHKGRWYINPKHPYYDFEDYPFDEITSTDLANIRNLDTENKDGSDGFAWDDVEAADFDNVMDTEPEDSDDLRDYLWDDFDAAELMTLQGT